MRFSLVTAFAAAFFVVFVAAAFGAGPSATSSVPRAVRMAERRISESALEYEGIMLRERLEGVPLCQVNPLSFLPPSTTQPLALRAKRALLRSRADR